ncbi:MAG: gephyrin-like molybdotransferase Glp [Terriglobales bacterium]
MAEISQLTANVLPLRDARQVVEEHASRVRPLASQPVDLLRCRGRILAEELVADRDLPPFARATRDGYAVRAADLDKLPARLEVAGEIRAGAPPETFPCPLQPGEAAEIMTGAPVPCGADAVVMVEYTVRHGDVVEVQRAVALGENVVPQGAEARRGDLLLGPGSRLTPVAIAVAASVGKVQVNVYRRPQVAILATGDELVEVGAQPGPSQIRNSNSYSLAAQVEASGGLPLKLPIAPDEPSALRRLVEQGLTADLLLLTGGVSAGKYDLVEQVLHDLGAEFFFTGALIQPGRPVVFGRVPASAIASLRGLGTAPASGEWKYFFGLPGNPVSTMVTFELFARVILDAFCGASPAKLVFVQARLKSGIQTKTGLTRFLPAILSGEYEDSEVELVRWQGSGDIAATARANCYIVLPPDRERIPAGAMVAVMVR